MDDCIFCKIVNNQIPSVTVYEDEVVKAFLDITQVTPGHTLLIPKKHVPDIFAYDADLAAEVFARIPMVARAIKAFDPRIEGMNIMNNNGAVAYQSVFHSHIHLLPRYGKDDDFSIQFGDNSADYTPEKLAAIGAAIQKEVRK